MGFNGSWVGESGPPQALPLSDKVQGQLSCSHVIKVISNTHMMQYQLSCCNSPQEVNQGVAVLPGQSKVSVSSPKPMPLRPALEWMGSSPTLVPRPPGPAQPWSLLVLGPQTSAQILPMNMWKFYLISITSFILSPYMWMSSHNALRLCLVLQQDL